MSVNASTKSITSGMIFMVFQSGIMFFTCAASPVVPFPREGPLMYRQMHPRCDLGRCLALFLV